MQIEESITAVVFMLITFITIFLFWKATSASKTFLIIIVLWLALQAIVSLNGFYQVTNSVPPRFILLILPPVLFIVFLFLTKKGRTFIDKLDTRWLLLLHTVRIPVEIVLFLLYTQKQVPGIMTFEGRNFDILSGITAPILFYFSFIKKSVGSNLLIAWNIICLGLLFNIVTIAILSAPFPFQQFAFDQPNIALLSFPFAWLPCCIVPLVFLSHVAALRQLLAKTGNKYAPVSKLPVA
jgi:hypothetical protein